jgi:hypothetical protein
LDVGRGQLALDVPHDAGIRNHANASDGGVFRVDGLHCFSPVSFGSLEENRD